MRQEFLNRYAAVEEVQQLILVRCDGKSEAQLELFCRRADDGWDSLMCCHAYVGKNGVGRAAENDSKTPLGDFGMVCAFGTKDDPGSLLPYIRVDENIWCCGDKEHYNRIIDIRDCPHDCSGEHMADYVLEYNYGLFFDYNIEGIPGLGFALFLHCKGSNSYTGGCIAVDEDNMLRILKTVDKNGRICIYKA